MTDGWKRVFKEQQHLKKLVNPVSEMKSLLGGAPVDGGIPRCGWIERLVEDDAQLRRDLGLFGFSRNRVGSLGEELRKVQRLRAEFGVQQSGFGTAATSIREQSGILADRRGGIGQGTRGGLDLFRERQRLLSNMAPAPNGGLTAAAEASRQRRLLHAPLLEARRLGLFGQTSTLRSLLGEAQRASDDRATLFRRPGASETMRLANEAWKASPLARSYLNANASLRSDMLKASTTWLNRSDQSRSLKAFADLAGIGQGLRTRSPYDRGLTDALRSSLGDWRQEMSPPTAGIVAPLSRTLL